MTGYSKIKRKKIPKYGAGTFNPGGVTYDANGNQTITSAHYQDSPDGDNSGGNFVSNNLGGLSKGANFVGNAIDSFNPGASSSAGTALTGVSSGLKGAASGAEIGAEFGPEGALIGGGIGLATGLVGGLLGGGKARREFLQRQATQRKAVADNAANQSNQTLRQYDNNGVEDAQLYGEGGNTPPLSPKYKGEWNNFVNWMQTTGHGKDPNLDVHTKTTGVDYLNQYKKLSGATQLSPDSVNRTQQELEDYKNQTWDKIQSGKVASDAKTKDQYMPNLSPVDGWLGSKTSNEMFPSAIENNKTLGYVNPNAVGNLAVKPNYRKGGRIKTDPNVEYPNFPLYADGADLSQPVDPNAQPYEAEQGEVVQGNANMEQSQPIASDMQMIGGDSHENGGTMGVGGDRIYSDRLKISPVLREVLKTSGIKVNQNSTYAQVSSKLGKLKGKFEAKTDGVGKSTANVMLPRLEQALDDTFNDQEIGKQNTELKKFAKGGRMYDDGGDPSQDNSLPYGRSNPLPNATELNFDGTPINPNAQPFTSNNPNSLPALSGTGIDRMGNIVPQPSTLDKIGNFIDNNAGQIGNLGTYLANTGTINKLSTQVSPSYLATPNYNYVDRSGSAINRNSALLKTGIRSLGNAGQTVNAANIGALYSKTIAGNSDIAANENLRKDNYDNNYNQRADRINAENVAIGNKASDDSRDLYNQKLALRLGARNAFQQGVEGNIASKNAEKLNREQIKLIGLTNNTNGVTDRTKAKLKISNPDLFKQLFPNE